MTWYFSYQASIFFFHFCRTHIRTFVFLIKTQPTSNKSLKMHILKECTLHIKRAFLKKNFFSQNFDFSILTYKMCEQYSSIDQLDPDNIPLAKKELELESILKLCIESSKAFNARFSSSLTPQQCFFLKLLGDYSGLDPRIQSFWSNSALFDSLNPAWEINLSTDVFSLINSEPGHQIFYMFYLIDLMKGRFEIIQKTEEYYLIDSLDSNLTSLLSLIVAEKNSIKCFKILVGTKGHKTIEESITMTIEEFCTNSRELQIMNMLDSDIICNESECLPSYFGLENNEFINEEMKNETEEIKNETEEMKNKTEEVKNETKDIKNETEEVKNEIEELFEKSEHQIVEIQEEAKFSLNEKTIKKKTLSRPTSPACRTIFLGDEHSPVKKHKRNISSFDKGTGSNFYNYKQSFQSLKENIERNLLNYKSLLNLGNNVDGKWVSIVLSYLEKQLSVQLTFDLFAEFNLKWKICIEQNLLENLKKLKEQDFLVYLRKIFKFGKGEVIEDYKEFTNLNHQIDQDFIIVPIIVKELNLKPIFSVLCTEISSITKDYEYRLKLIDFYSPETLELQLENFKANGKYSKVKEVWQKPGMMSLVTKTKERELIPTHPLSQISIQKPIKTLFFLCYLPRDSKLFNFYIQNHLSGSIKGSKQMLEHNDSDLNVHIIKFEVNWSADTSFVLKFNNGMSFKDSNFTDNTNRHVKSDEYQFFFDLNLNKIPITQNKVPRHIHIIDLYYQFFLYLTYYHKNAKLVELEYLIKSFGEIEKTENSSTNNIQDKIVSYVNSNYLSNLDCNDLKLLYLSLSILGSTQNFDSVKGGIENVCLKKVIKILDEQDKFLEIFKPSVNYKLVIKGLAKIFALAKIKNNSEIKYFENIVDYNSLHTIINEYLKILQAHKTLTTPDEIDKFVKYCECFEEKTKKKVLKLVLESHMTLDQLSKLILCPKFEYMKIDSKKKIFLKALKTFKFGFGDLLRFLEFTKANNEFYALGIICKTKMAKFIDNHLKGNNTISQSDFQVIGSVLGILHSENYFKDESLKKFLKIQILNFNFQDCTDLFLLLPKFVPEMFKDYITRICDGQASLESLQLIENSLELFPNEVQKATMLYLFENYTLLNLRRLVEYAYKTESSILKKCYKKVFNNKLLDKSNHKLCSDTFDYLIRLKDNTKNFDNHILFELLSGNPLYFSLSNQELYEDIIENPKPNENLKKILNSHETLKNQKNYQDTLSFIMQVANNIQSKHMDFKTFELILQHSDEQSNIFFEYIQDALNDPVEFDNFKLEFSKIKEEVFETKKNFKQLVKIIYSPLLKMPQISRALKSYEILLNNSSKFSIKEFVSPNKLLGLFQLIKLPFKSRIFKCCILRELLRPDVNMEIFIDSAHNLVGNFLLSLTRLDEQALKLEEIEIFVEYIDSEEISGREIKALCEGFQTVSKQDPSLDQKLKTIFTDFILYKDYKQLLSFITTSYKVLGLPLQLFEKYVFSNSDFYSEDFSCALAELKTIQLSSFNKAQIRSLTLFFNEVSNNKELIFYLNSVKEYEKNLWFESFVETSEKDLSSELVEMFSAIWSFLNELKKSVNVLPIYLSKIVELIEIKEYSGVIEFIKKCGSKVEAFKDFNSSQDTQEHVYFSKIKMIHSDSKLIINRKQSYLAKIFPKNPDGGYSTNKIYSNELGLLRDRALLSKEILEQRKSKGKFYGTRDLRIYSEFICYVDVLKEYLAALNELGESLYEDLLEKTEYFIKDGDFRLLNADNIEKNEALKQWGKSFEEAKEQCYMMNTLNNEMVCLVDKFVYDRSQENLDRIMWVFRYANKKTPIALNIKISPPDDIKDRVKYLVNFLNTLKDSKLSIQLSPETRIRTKITSSILLANTREFYRAVLLIYSNYHNTIPRPDLVLFCYHSTDWTELKRFLNRCVLNTRKEIYTLVNPEDLTLVNQKMFDSALNILFKKEVFFSLAIVTNDMKSSLVSSLVFNPSVIIEKIESLVFTDEKILDFIMRFAQNYLVVTSTFVGLGKSEFIYRAAKDNNVSLFEINVSATYDNIGILEKIKNVIQPDPAMYKFNLNFLSDPEYFHKLIFELAVFNMIYNDKTFIIIPEGSYIVIEVANTYKNKLYKSLPFLKFLLTETINEFQLDNLMVTEELIYVCNYLSLLDSGEINKTDLEYDKDSKKVLFIDPITFSTLLQKYFIPNCGEFPNYHQLNAFVKVLKSLFQHFEKSLFSSSIISYLISDYRNQDMDIFTQLRSSIINIIIETSKEFTTKCVDSAKNNQSSAHDSLKDDARNEFSVIENSVKWENSNHFIMVFLAEDFSSIYRLPDMVPQFIKKFIISQAIIKELRFANIYGKFKERWENCKNGVGDIEDYNNYNSTELIHKLLLFYKQFSLIRIPGIDEENESAETIIKRRLSDAQSTGYILTPDNYLKMNLIYLRCMSNLPLIIMGETGCGKTSLLRFFVEKILRETLLIVYINSEIKVSDIQEHLESANEQAKNQGNRRVWVFFDEFNTSDCIGEIITIFCERKFEGLELHSNLVFLGACNPYRVKSGVNYKENVGIKKKITNNLQLVHLVKPLSDKAFEFIWDFGALKPDEIEKYVNSMLLHEDLKHIDYFTKLICTAHEYFQNHEDCSSVSLRDVKRFVLLYKWFSESIKERKNFKVKNPLSEYQDCYKIVQELKCDENILAPLLSFVHCYYLRLSTEEQRNVFIDFIVFEASNFHIQFTSDEIHSLIKFQELDLICRMEVPKDIALNKALMENVFAIVPCIFCKVPIFICGKPGTSKSLAVNIIFSSIRGESSSDDYLKTLPKLHITNFLGSESCTSEDIQYIFDKALRSLDENKEILPVVLFDEIGLAETAKGNPLKVLHKLLEYENCKVSFIGISNWRLDASKMNRALYLARLDPDEADLKKTALALFTSKIQRNDYSQYLPMIEYLAKGYYNMKQAYSQTDFPDFFGLRDFYHTIKYIALNLERTQFKILIQQALFRNFDGLPNSLNELNIYFPVFTGSEVPRNPVQLIESNLLDPHSRYLMIICAQDVSEYLKNEILSKYLLEYRLMVGSTFHKDLIQQESQFKSLSDVIGYMEQGVSVIMQDMDSIYTSLYSLFNQNFTMIMSKYYCSVALGSHYNPRCGVHNKFKAIVFLNDDQSLLKNVDAPFLNRFEKHNVAIIDILDEDDLEIAAKICIWVQDVVTISGRKNLLGVNSVFPVFSQETINLFLTLYATCQNKTQRLKRFLLQNASMDIVLLCRMNNLDGADKEKTMIDWKELHSLSIEKYFCKLADKQLYLNKNKAVKMISVTYDTARIIFGDKNLYKFVLIEKLSNIKCEEEFRMSFEAFLNEMETVIYVLELNYSKESHHLRFVTSLIESILQEYKPERENFVKHVCIIIRQKRCDEKRKPLLLFKNWRYKMFETLSGRSDQIINEIIKKSIKSIVKKEKKFKLDDHIKKIVRKSLETLSLKSSLFDNLYFSTLKDSIANEIKKNSEILQKFKNKILSSFDILGSQAKEKWIVELFVNGKITYNASSLRNAQNEFISHHVFLELTKLLVGCEKISGLSSIKSASESNMQLCLWLNTFENLTTNTTQVQLKPNFNYIPFMCECKLPFFYQVYKVLKQRYQELVEQNLNENLIKVELNKYYLNNTIWKESPALFFENEEFRGHFIRDFIEISLVEKLIEERQVSFIVQFILSSFRSIETEFRLKSLFDNQFKIISFNKLILLYLKYSENHNWIIELLDSDLPFKDVMENLFDRIIEDFFPHNFGLSDLEGLKLYAQDISELENSLLNFNSNLNLKNFYLLEFWVKLCKLNNINLFSQILLKISGGGHEILFESRTVSWIIETVSRAQGLDKISTYMFKAFYFNQIFQRNVEMAPFIIDQINTADAWKYSGQLILEMFKKSGLKETLFQIERGNKDFDSILEEMNPLLHKIAEKVERLDLKSPFCVLFSDTVKSIKFKIRPFTYGEVVKQYMDYIETSNHGQDKLKLLIAVGRTQFFLNEFTEIINPKHQEKDAYENEIIISMANALQQREILTYELYCLKVLNGLIRENIRKLYECIHKTEFRWRIDCNEIGEYMSLLVFPVAEDVINGGRYTNIIKKIIRLRENVNELDDEISEQQDPLSTFELGLAFLNTIYLIKSQIDPDMTAYNHWFYEKKNTLVQQFGPEFTSLIKNFIENYPENSLCYLYINIEEDKFNTAMFINYLALITISYSKLPNCFSSQFFKVDGQPFESISESSKQIYFIGAETPEMQSYLKSIQENFEKLRSKTFFEPYSKGGSYVCSHNCDFFYIIENCGGPRVKSICPYCRNEIGGLNHILVERPGHRNLTDDEAKEFLRERGEFYRELEPKGFRRFFTNASLTRQRKLNYKMTLPLLNFLTNSAFYYLLLAKVYGEIDLKAVYSIDVESLQTEIEHILIQNYKELKENINGQGFSLWMLEAINKVREVMQEFYGDSGIKETRDEFEKCFENKIMTKSYFEISNGYKFILNTQTESPAIIKYIEETKLPTEDYYKFTHLFRYTSKPTFDMMAKELLSTKNYDEYQLLSFYNNELKNLENLKYLWPIVKFSREMISECSFEVSRAEAKIITMRELLIEKENLRESFNEFCKAWNSLQITLQIECKTYDMIQITEETPIGYLLIDTQINSLGIHLTAGIYSLFNLQNKIRSMLPVKSNEDLKKFELTNISKEDIFYISPDELKLLVKKVSINSFEYGKGQEIFFNYSQFDNDLKRILEKSKLLDNRKLEIFQYKYELLHSTSKYSGIINEIRNNIRQISLEDSEAELIKREIVVRAGNWNADTINVWIQAYNWLGKAIFNVRYSNFNADDIESFNGIILKARQNFIVNEIFTRFKVGQFIPIYELVELEIYHKVVRSVDQQYKMEFDDTRSNLMISDFIDLVFFKFSKDAVIECHNVLKRIIIRVLTSVTDSTFIIKNYFSMESYWSFKYLDVFEEIAEIFPGDFIFAYAIEIEKLFETRIKEL